MFRCSGNDRDGKGKDTGRMQDNRSVVQVTENVYAKRIDKAVTDQEASVDADDLARTSSKVWLFDLGKRSDQIGASEGDTCCNGD